MLVHLVTHYVADMERQRDGQILTKAFHYVKTRSLGKGWCIVSSDLIYFVVKERDKENVLIPCHKKVVAHLQVPVMNVKQKCKVPNLLGNKQKKKWI